MGRGGSYADTTHEEKERRRGVKEKHLFGSFAKRVQKKAKNSVEAAGWQKKKTRG